METKKREIKPYKGGRTARFECRMNPDIKKKIKKIAKKKGVSVADLIELWFKKHSNKV